MFEVILLIIGVAAGFCLYKMLIMSDSRQSTISTKILSAITDKSNTDSSALAVRIREDINNSYRLEFQDLKSCITNYFCSNGTCNKTPDSTSSSSSEKEYKDDEIEVLLKSKFNFLKDWDIRSLSKRETAVTEEPMAENKADKETPSSPEKTEPAAESKPKQVDDWNKPDKKASSPEDQTRKVDDWNKPDEKASSSPKKTEPVAGSKPRKENTPHGGNSKK